MNLQAIAAIYGFEMNRTRRTLGQSVVSPVLSTSLYFMRGPMAEPNTTK